MKWDTRLRGCDSMCCERLRDKSGHSRAGGVERHLYKNGDLNSTPIFFFFQSIKPIARVIYGS